VIFKVRDQSPNLVNRDAVKVDDLTSLSLKLYEFVSQFSIMLRRVSDPDFTPRPLNHFQLHRFPRKRESDIFSLLFALYF